MRQPLLFVETVVVLATVAVVVHLAASVDWPWAVVAGAAVTVVLRALIHPKTPSPH